MSKIDRAEVERVIDDLETQMKNCELKPIARKVDATLGESFVEYTHYITKAANHEGKRQAYQYAIDRLKELL